MDPSEEDFERKLWKIFQDAESNRRPYVDIVSADLHIKVGCYPDDTDQRMPICCNTMKKLMRQEDEILDSPPKGQGPTLKIRYYLPR